MYCWYASLISSSRALRFLRLSASNWTTVAACPRSSLKTVMSISSEKREINPKALDSVRLRESLERFVDGGAGAEVEKVHRSPDEERLSRAHPGEDQNLQVEGGPAMGSSLS
jgi:hypothetical protein